MFPAAGYAEEVQSHGGKVAVFNLDRSNGDEEADFLFLGPAEDKLPEALGLHELYFNDQEEQETDETAS